MYPENVCSASDDLQSSHKCVPILNRFQDKARYWSKIAIVFVKRLLRVTLRKFDQKQHY